MDTKTPFYVSIFTIAVNTVLSLISVVWLKLPVWYIAGAFSISMILNVSILFFILSRKIEGFNVNFLLIESVKMLSATFISSIIVYYFMRFLDGLVFDTAYTINVFFLLAIGGIFYFILYIFLSWLLNVREIYLIGKLTSKAKEYRKRIVEFYTLYE